MTRAQALSLLRFALPWILERVKGDVPGHEFHGNQWTGGGGGEARPYERPIRKYELDARPSSGAKAQLFEDIRSLAEKNGFPPDRVIYQKTPYLFEVNGEQMSAAGAYLPNSEIIEIYDHGLEDPRFASTMMGHEVAHYKFAQVSEFSRMSRDELYGNEDEQATHPDRYLPDGRITTPAQIKYYPELYVTRPLSGNRESQAQFRKLREGDGVTNYSKAYWKQFEAQGGTDSNMRRNALNETLAEIAGFEASHGTTPPMSREWETYYDAFKRAYARTQGD